MLEPASSVCFDPTQAFGNLSLSRTKRIENAQQLLTIGRRQVRIDLPYERLEVPEDFIGDGHEKPPAKHIDFQSMQIARFESLIIIH